MILLSMLHIWKRRTNAQETVTRGSNLKPINEWTNEEIVNDLFNAAGRYEKATPEQQEFIDRILNERVREVALDVRSRVGENPGKFTEERDAALKELLKIHHG